MRVIKRIFDILFALAVIIVLSPVFIIISILVRINLGNPIFFKQERVGLYNTEFKMYKFRTMKEAFYKNGELLPDSERLTKFGKILRSTSLDELPEFFNILKGEMSLIGPRPLLKEYLPLYNDEQIKRHNTLPGLTGWAQVNGRNNVSWNEKFKLDVWYVENWNLKLDIKIFFMTIYKVIKKEGISSEGQATMEYFNGSN
ncbi:MAG: sugar transferase [Clostridium sp.]|uniref:sugar transferase n=1 Tax=Clostridium sp. TaxID=1506 RepID=UPI003F3E67CF